ncbi:MAG: YafY family transcriptional regulator [Chloroflexi bacterium]|nr:YafY family transcriptional regulator [Chloroflexota bacterium]
MANTATRLITLIMLLQRQPNQTAAQLAQELDVSVRTVQRYITMLDEMGIPIYAERGPYGGYALVRGYKMPPLVFSPEEAVAIYLGTSFLEQVWGHLYQEAGRGALAKLDNVLPDEQRREVAWARQALLAIGMHWTDPNLSAPHLEKLWAAVHERRRVRLIYRGRSQPEPLQRDFDPYVLVHGWGWRYCVGYCHLRQAIRSFRMDRMLDLVLLDQTFEVPADFDLQAYVETEPYFQRQVRVRLCFAPETALLALDNRAYWDTFEEQPDGSIIVTFATPELEAAASIVMSHGYLAVVLEPEELRELVRERARAIAARHVSSDQMPEKQ